MRKHVVPSLVAASVAAAFVISYALRLSSSSLGELVKRAVAELPKEITEVAEKVSRPGKHLGFDTYRYPGDAVMRAWRHSDVPYEWVGYYLPAPCHKGRTWMGKRERLANMAGGWR